MTDTITLPRSVVEQALNWALNHGEKIYAAGGIESIDSMNAWAEVLRATLEQPQVQSGGIPPDWKLVPAEPTIPMLHRADGLTCIDFAALGEEGAFDLDELKEIYRAMLAAAPQPPAAEKSSGVEQPQSVTDCHQAQPQGEHEPVAWINPGAMEWGKRQCEKVLKLTRKAQPEYDFTEPLYTRPPARQPLTDAQIDDHMLALLYDGEDLPDPWGFKQGVRAAERAHGIGGEV